MYSYSVNEPDVYQNAEHSFFIQRVKANIRLNCQALIEFYFAATLAQCNYPTYHVLFLNNQYQLTHTLEMVQGPLDALEGIAKAIAQQARDLNSENIIVAHNLEKQKPIPKERDHLFRRLLKTQLAKATMQLHGYYLVGESYVVSVAERYPA